MDENEQKGVFDNFVAWLKFFFCFNGDVHNENYTAKQACLASLGDDLELDDSKRVNKFIEKVNQLIKYKTGLGENETNCTKNFPKHILKYKSEIIQYFVDRGYEAFDASEETARIKKPQLYVSWDEKYNDEHEV